MNRDCRLRAVILSVEEAEYTIGMVSDWIELDSPDAWVRYDSELVRASRSFPTHLT